ncbi:protein kinase domain-containing protein [Caerostris darwini]|uniref:non-specific serine/threonine protein kinase n=1 Tax=Caerostris darwini TaxID=1538125 RepID=A0AAV4Q6Q9_9ARAC|nr:protein kinase domain-containing protein [Caerostris darwini]
MSDQFLLKPSELKSFIKFEEMSSFKLKHFLNFGHFTKALLLEDIFTQHNAVGKIVTTQNEGEIYHWPSLHHENLIPLLKVITLDADRAIYVFPFLEKSLRTVIQETNFIQHPKCFERKRCYAKDILCGLDYLHENTLNLMNLDDQNVLICNETDKAIISDFSCSLSAKTVTKSNCPPVSSGIPPPEVLSFDQDCVFECMPFDIWCCGVMFLQMFTTYVLPWCELQTSLLDGLDEKLVKKTNIGSNLQDGTTASLNEFLESFLQKDPKLRTSAAEALGSPFLRNSKKRIDEEARLFWKKCEMEKVMHEENLENSKFCNYFRESDQLLFERNDFKEMMAAKCVDEDCLRKSNIEIYSDECNQQAKLYKDSLFDYFSSNHSIEENFQTKIRTNLDCNLHDFNPEIFYQTSTDKDQCIVNKAWESENKFKFESQTEIKVNKSLLLTDSSKSNEEIIRNSSHEIVTRGCTDARYFTRPNLAIDLSCNCVSCKLSSVIDDSSQRIRSLPLSNISNMNCKIAKAPIIKELRITPFCQMQGGFLHNNWKVGKNNLDGVTGFSEQPSTSNHTGTVVVNGFAPVKVTWPLVIKKFQTSEKNGVQDGDLENNKNSLLFEKCIGFRRKFKYKLNKSISKQSSKCDDSTDLKLSSFPLDCGSKDTSNKEDGSMKNDYISEETSNENTVDISMELPLCSESSKNGTMELKLSKTAYKDKPKQRLFRMLCPGSDTEGKSIPQEISNENIC